MTRLERGRTKDGGGAGRRRNSQPLTSLQARVGDAIDDNAIQTRRSASNTQKVIWSSEARQQIAHYKVFRRKLWQPA
jgi:hypothetical protein